MSFPKSVDSYFLIGLEYVSVTNHIRFLIHNNSNGCAHGFDNCHRAVIICHTFPHSSLDCQANQAYRFSPKVFTKAVRWLLERENHTILVHSQEGRVQKPSSFKGKKVLNEYIFIWCFVRILAKHHH